MGLAITPGCKLSRVEIQISALEIRYFPSTQNPSSYPGTSLVHPVPCFSNWVGPLRPKIHLPLAVKGFIFIQTLAHSILCFPHPHPFGSPDYISNLSSMHMWTIAHKFSSPIEWTPTHTPKTAPPIHNHESCGSGTQNRLATLQTVPTHR